MDNTRYTHGLKNLRLLIQQASSRYENEFVWQDIKLTDEFKAAYERYLQRNNYEIEFFESTAVITTSQTRYIFVPNQWFVIASYPVEIYVELQYYKERFKEIADYLGKQLTPYTKQLRDNPSAVDKSVFYQAADAVLKKHICPEKMEDAKAKLWRFVSDYSWWSGQKTIDRTDFCISVVLNMLNLVNVSQGYVADIVFAYGNDFHLRSLVHDLDVFTMDMTCNIVRDKDDAGQRSDLNIRAETSGAEDREPLPEKTKGPTRIKIKASSSKEIKMK